MANVIFAAKPSPAHRALVAGEEGLLNAVITQNVDGLHQTAGNTNVIEYHGNHRRLVCVGCGGKIDFTESEAGQIPYPICERCLAPLKPDVVFFGEAIPMAEMVRANEEARRCKVMFVMAPGVVYPAADLPFLPGRRSHHRGDQSRGNAVHLFHIEFSLRAAHLQCSCNS
jgi:NAD-dependent deacetylase